MADLQDLPAETLILILRLLGAMDLQTTILAQRVSRRFRDVIQDAVPRSPSPGATQYYSENARSKGEINPFLQDKFNGLFNSADCFTEAECRRYRVLTLDGDATLPFPRLPWVVGASRDVFLRPEASWRGLSPTFGVAPHTRYLDIVKNCENEFDSPVFYFQVELPESGLSMGLLYDILVCEETLYAHWTGSWQLLVGKSLKRFDVLYRWGCFIINEPGESQLVSETADGAILLVRGGPPSRLPQLGRDAWVPERLMKNAKPKFFPWRGPCVDEEETVWYLDL
ncbi:hypothetical protein RRF57_012290 [Xylaria bambusicola]|uniref:F-box domain-containing protein n=1 Tax=Xylaria bambusicola TaxID=326684 RepID=A0AAN7ZEL9_9PEZI